MLRSRCLLLMLFLASGLNAASISGDASGFANATPDFWGIEFLTGDSGDSIASVSLTIPPPGSFDFSGAGNYLNQTAPIVDAASSSGLSSGDVSFSFIGSLPSTITIDFAPGTFAPGDRLRFAADINGLGSKLGGALGAFGGAALMVSLADGRSGSAHLSTGTSVTSSAFVEIEPAAVPEANAGWFVLGGGAGIYVYRRQRDLRLQI